MIARAEEKYLRISPTKVRPILPLLKGEPVTKVFDVLAALKKRGAYYINKALKSAVANAKNKGYQEETLYVSRLAVNQGPTLKRYRAATFGRATMIRKRTSHIVVEVDTTEKAIEGVKVK